MLAHTAHTRAGDIMALNLDLHRLAADLAAASDPDVAKVAAGESGPLPRVFGLGEGLNRKRVRDEAAAAAAEADIGQPSMVDQYLQMYQQAMSGGPPQPPQMPQGMPPQGMPPRMPQGMPQGQMPRQMPRQMPQGMMPPRMPQGPPPSQQQGIGSMMPPQMPPRRPMPQGMPQGMGQGAPQGMPPQMGMARGGLVRGYANGGGVGGEMPAEEPVEVVEEDPGIISDAIDWAQENPAAAAEIGVGALLTLAAFTPVGAGAALIGGGTRGAIWAAKAARALGPKVMKFIRSTKPVARATKKADKKLGPAPSNQAMRNAYGGFDTKEIVDRPALINKLAKGYRRTGAAQLGLAGLSAAKLLGGEDEEAPVGDAAAAGAGDAAVVGGGGGGNVDPSTYAAPGYLMGSKAPQEFEAMTEDEMYPPGFFDNFTDAGWMGIINAGLSLAAPQGDSQGFGQDLANAAKSGLGTFTEQTAFDRARTNDELDRDIMLEQSEYDISQRELTREHQRADIALTNAQADQSRARAGERMNPRQAILTAQAHFDAGDADIDPIEVNKLARYYEQYGLEGLDIYLGENAQISTLAEDPPTGWFWDR